MEMEIRTARLRIVPLKLAHLEATHAYLSDAENTRMMMFFPVASLDETEAYIRKAEAQWGSEKPSVLDFAVFAGATQIGGLTLYLYDNDTAEFAWVLDRRYQGQGYALEAARGLMDSARSALGIRRFIAQCDSENTASRRLMERLGMRQTDVIGRRKNRSSDEERLEVTYEILC